MRRSSTINFNLVPFALMAGGWLSPLLMFWLYVWGPLRPFHYPAGDLGPNWVVLLLVGSACFALSWLPASYYRLRSFEVDGRLYEMLGVRLFRRLVPDGDLANRIRRKREPGFRIIGSRAEAERFADRTVAGERGHLVLLAVGVASAAYAWRIGWHTWAMYLTAGNVLVNVYPILLQRYTRTRLARLSRRRDVHG